MTCLEGLLRVIPADCNRCGAPARRAELGAYTHLQRPPRATQTRPGWRHTPLQALLRARPQAGASQLHPPSGFGTHLNSASGQVPWQAGAALSEQVPASGGSSDDEHTRSPSRAHRRTTASLQARRLCPLAVMQDRTALPHARRHSWRDPPSAGRAKTASSSAVVNLAVARILHARLRNAAASIDETRVRTRGGAVEDAEVATRLTPPGRAR